MRGVGAPRVSFLPLGAPPCRRKAATSSTDETPATVTSGCRSPGWGHRRRPSMRRSGRQGWAGQVRGRIGCVRIDRQPLDLRVRGPAHHRRSGVARGLVAAESGAKDLPPPKPLQAHPTGRRMGQRHKPGVSLDAFGSAVRACAAEITEPSTRTLAGSAPGRWRRRGPIAVHRGRPRAPARWSRA